jgi:hypothetical protein
MQSLLFKTSFQVNLLFYGANQKSIIQKAIWKFSFQISETLEL